ncbi:hypothetical protein Q8G46_28250, partial [Klebsiella pneumoniae]|uniref:hypothetical protein n=1 Tax=Klebsiella pneumoniae TaxID=573 RepID=UPI003013F587
QADLEDSDGSVESKDEIMDDQSSSQSEISEEDEENHLDDEDEMGNASKWKDSLAERTVLRQNTNLMQLVYGKPLKSTTS